ncbi:MAG: hypothetical protein M1816_002717 [Peltula sp. TS41687]|nr:MAG: hypothetical protein M1816_002717 [Peltula sp. TS41687]
MAYSDDSVMAKLSALNETQESIVTVAQWIMFHRRHAERTVRCWFQRLKDSGTSKRLNLIYLANEVAQQSKARRKNDFLVAFSPIIAEATTIAYRGATKEVQLKLRHVVEVWRQRQIFELPIQEAMEARIAELDKSRLSGKKPLFGGSLGGGSFESVPPEIQPLVPLQATLSKLAPNKASSIAAANSQFDKLHDPSTQAPTPPVHAAQLSGLLKSLASAEGAVAESIKARQALIQTLENLLDKNRNIFNTEQSQQQELTSRKAITEAQKREVEDGIMRGLAEESNAGDGNPNSVEGDDSQRPPEPERPAIEGLSPPSADALTPTGTPPPSSSAATTAATSTLPGLSAEPAHLEPPSVPAIPAPTAVLAADEFLASLNIPPRPTTTTTTTSLAGMVAINGAGTKKRKLNNDPVDEFASLGSADALDGLDADVVEFLRQDSGNYQ